MSLMKMAMQAHQETSSDRQVSIPKSRASGQISGMCYGATLALLSLLTDPTATQASDGYSMERVAEDRVDLVEINHFYDDQGRLVFDQVIYYDWCSQTDRYQVRDWRLLKDPFQIPLRDWHNGGYSSEWRDPKQRDGLRRVRSTSVRETWTQDDPELEEREVLAQEKRKELQRINPKPCAPRTTSESRSIGRDPISDPLDAH